MSGESGTSRDFSTEERGASCDECGLRLAINHVEGRNLCGPCTGRHVAAPPQKNRGASRESLAEVATRARNLRDHIAAGRVEFGGSNPDALVQWAVIVEEYLDATEPIADEIEALLSESPAARLSRTAKPPAWCEVHHLRTQDGWAWHGGKPICNEIVRREGGIPILCSMEVDLGTERERFADFYGLDPATLTEIPPAKNELASELRAAATAAADRADSAPGPLAAAPHRAMARTAEAMATAAEEVIGEPMRVVVYRDRERGRENIEATYGPLSPEYASEKVRALREEGIDSFRIDVVVYRPPPSAAEVQQVHEHECALNNHTWEIVEEMAGPVGLVCTHCGAAKLILTTEQREAVANAASIVGRLAGVWEHYGGVDVNEMLAALNTIGRD